MNDTKRQRLRGVRILVVDDAQHIRDVFTMLLESEGAVVVTASSAREAIDAVGRAEFDVLLTDLGLPDMPGERLIRKIVDSAKHRPRIVAVSGTDEPHLSGARRAGADVVLQKPFTLDDLLAMLGPVVRYHRHAVGAGS